MRRDGQRRGLFTDVSLTNTSLSHEELTFFHLTIVQYFGRHNSECTEYDYHVDSVRYGKSTQQITYISVRYTARLFRRIAWIALWVSLAICCVAISPQPPRNSPRSESSPMQQRGGRDPGFDGRGLGGRGIGGGGMPPANRSDYPMWKIDPAFQQDVFTFVRIEYDSFGGRRSSFGGWRNDFPDCDWNFSTRLQELTSLIVDPNGKTMRFTDPALLDFPFVFMTNAGAIALSEDEKIALRNYLMKGGFLMADDFWAAAEWSHLRDTMKEVLPNREPVELTLEHELFHLVYNFAKLPQVPSIRAWQSGLTYESWHGPYENGDTSPHFWGYFDDQNRLMAVFCQNNDIADGWEREGEDIEYFENYSLKYSYPLGINIIVYAMTH